MNKRITVCITLISLLILSTPLTGGFNGIQGQTHNNPSSETLNQLPEAFSWKDVNGMDYTTAIRNQKRLPSCETFAIVAALETMIQYKVGFPFGCDLSEAHLYFYSGGNTDWGSYPENNTNFLQTYGVPDEACWPYPDDNYQYPLNTTEENWKERTVKINSWHYLSEDVETIKSAVMNNGPVPTYFHVYADFLKHKHGVYRHRWGESFGPHYVCIMGWNDDPGYWICKNSWGTEYQEDGWFKIAYGECSIEKKSFYLNGVHGHYPILFVDDDNTKGPWKGTEQHPFQSIQDAVNHAYDGWTIIVNPGEYQEHVFINASITLVGSDKQSTVIDGGNMGHVVTIASPEVNVSGFTIQNSGTEPFDAGMKTLSLYSNATIYNNIFQQNQIGLFLNYAYTEEYGKFSWNHIRNNVFQQNHDGMYVHWSDNNEIIGNVFRGNVDDGLEMEASRFSLIEGNVFQENEGIGLYLQDGSHQNRIQKNDFVENTIHAYFDGSLRNKWIRNYWSDSHHIFIQPINGQLDIYDIPWVDIDWFPSLKPYQ